MKLCHHDRHAPHVTAVSRSCSRSTSSDSEADFRLTANRGVIRAPVVLIVIGEILDLHECLDASGQPMRGRQCCQRITTLQRRELTVHSQTILRKTDLIKKVPAHELIAATAQYLPRPHDVEPDRGACRRIRHSNRPRVLWQVVERRAGIIFAAIQYRAILGCDAERPALGPAICPFGREWSGRDRSLQLPALITNTPNIQMLAYG
jgi:hypothetical protein